MTTTVTGLAGTSPGTALSPLFAPRGIAVVGASRGPGKLGATMARSLSGSALRGGHLALAAAGDGQIDLAIICVPAPACAEVLADADAARAAVTVGDLLVANPDLDEIEVNPLRRTPTGLVALDAVVIPRESSHA